MPPQDERARLIKGWNRAAAGWARQQLTFDAASSPVTEAMIATAQLQPGERVLELGSGLGATGLVAAAQVGEEGAVVLSDAAQRMVERLRERTKGIANVEVRELYAEALKFDTAATDAVLARWMYMLLLDPVSALQETRRVLAPGGRVVLAAWTGAEDNPWRGATFPALRDRGLVGAPDADGPHLFAWADPDRIIEALDAAAFFDPQITQASFSFEFAGVDDWWDMLLDLSPELALRIGEISPEERDELLEELQRDLSAYTQADGSVVLPAKSHVVRADV
ncbi:MAG: methyltransferase domain-containing protein [Patulibacter sp.]